MALQTGMIQTLSEELPEGLVKMCILSQQVLSGATDTSFLFFFFSLKFFFFNMSYLNIFIQFGKIWLLFYVLLLAMRCVGP